MSGNANQEIILGDSDIVYPNRIGNLYSPVTLNTASGTGLVTIATGNPGYYITELGFQADLTCTIAAAGMISIVFSDSSSGAFATFRLYLPSAATPPAFASTLREVNQGPFVWSNKVANSVASVNLNTALTAGTIRCFVRYGTTSYLG